MPPCNHFTRARTRLAIFGALSCFAATTLCAQVPEQQGDTLGLLTPENVWYGDTLRMSLQSRKAGVTGFTASSVSTILPGQPAPVGSREILPPNIFRYIPGPSDFAPFRVHFRATANDGALLDSDFVDIHPNPQLPPEVDALPIAPPSATFPQADDRIYTGANAIYDIDDSRDVNGQWYNGLPQDTLVHATLVGKTIVLRKGTGFYDAYFRGRGDIRSLTIHADSLVIGNTISVPSAELRIKARVLTFVDSDDDHPIIDTRPMNWRLTSGYDADDRKYKKGGRGFDGGSVLLEVRTVIAPQGYVRFDVRGGDGQNITGGSADLPGEAAGGGGNGGTLTVRTPIDGRFFDPIVNLAPGQAGRNLATQKLAEAGDGTAGRIVHEPRDYAWMSPGSMRMAYNHAMDTYIDGFLDYAGQATGRIVADVDAIQQSSEWAALDPSSQNDLTQLQQEATSRLFQLRNNLDYFGNPPGWTPPLSFAASYALYKDEIEPTMRILMLARWIGDTMATLQGRIDALAKTRSEQADLVERLTSEFEDANGKLGPLNTEIEVLDREIAAAQKELADLQEELRRRAEEAKKPKEKKWWQKVCTIAGAVAQVVPVFQPALGLVGQGLTIAGNFDPKDPLASLGPAIDLIRTVKDSNVIERTASNWGALVDDLGRTVKSIEEQPNDAERIKAIVSAIRDAKGKYYDPAREAYKQAVQAQQAGSATRDAVAAQLGQIASQGSEFAAVTAKIASLMGRKEETVRKFGSTITRAAEAETGVTNAALSIEATNRESAGAILAFDPRLLAYAKDMEFRAKHRLLLYRYYLKKAYEYTFLQPYDRSLTRLENVVTQLDSLMKPGNQGMTEELKISRLTTAYEADLRDLKQGIIEDIVGQTTPQYYKSSFHHDFSSDQLNALNRGERVAINFSESRQNSPSNERLRLQSVTVVGLDASKTSDRAAKLEIVHSGVSTMTSEGKRYLFRHYNNQAVDYPVKWIANVDTAGDWSNDTVDNTVGSILGALLGKDQGAMEFFAGTGMDADIYFQFDANARGSIALDSLRVRVNYTYAPAPDGADRPRVLRVRTSNPLYQPYYDIDKAARNSHRPSYRTSQPVVKREDGRGELWRSYSEGETVTVLAPLEYGESRFRQWQDSEGRRIASDGPRLSVTMNRYQDVTAVYGDAPSVDVPVEAVAGEPFEGIVAVTPNPIGDAGRIRLQIARASHVRVTIVDAGGREIATLMDEARDAGTADLDLTGLQLGSGTYFARMTTGRTSSVKTFTVNR